MKTPTVSFPFLCCQNTINSSNALKIPTYSHFAANSCLLQPSVTGVCFIPVVLPIPAFHTNEIRSQASMTSWVKTPAGNGTSVMWQGERYSSVMRSQASSEAVPLGTSQMFSVFSFPQVGEAWVRPQPVGLPLPSFWGQALSRAECPGAIQNGSSPSLCQSTREFSQIFTVATYLELMWRKLNKSLSPLLPPVTGSRWSF